MRTARTSDRPRRARGPFRASSRQFLRIAVALLVVLQFLQACDSESLRKRAERSILDSTKLPERYQLLDVWVPGNGGGGPIANYELAKGIPSVSAVRVPQGYSRIDSVPRTFDSWVPALERSVTWHTMATFEGPSPDGQGRCLLTVSTTVQSPRALLSLSAGCNLDGPIRPRS
jgi:hypothetical protein